MSGHPVRYRLTCLTPTLVGDGSRLSPIDYMVWKDQVNVLDQRRIFRLLAKGPRLEGYLTQIRRADRLDFASWGGFAQNFAGRRIPFDHPGYTAAWERLRAENLHIPTFVCGPRGPFLPGSALKGALRTAMVASRTTDRTLGEIAERLRRDPQLRRPAEGAENNALGSGGGDRLKGLSLADSAAVPHTAMRIYLLRVATLQAQGGGVGRFALGWKRIPGGAVEARRVDDATPTFAEMAAPGTVFEGTWAERRFFSSPETVRALRWPEAPPTTSDLVRTANDWAGRLLALHRQFAEWTQLTLLEKSLRELEARLVQVREQDRACLVCLGWGTGLLAKSACSDTDQEAYHRVMNEVSIYAKALRSGLPFPKTRRVVFAGNQPAALAGWALLEIV